MGDRCEACKANRRERNRKAYAAHKGREQAMRDCGLVKVRGALGGVYWE